MIATLQPLEDVFRLPRSEQDAIFRDVWNALEGAKVNDEELAELVDLAMKLRGRGVTLHSPRHSTTSEAKQDRYHAASHESIEQRIAVMAKCRKFPPNRNVVIGLAGAYNVVLQAEGERPWVYMPGCFDGVRGGDVLAMLHHHSSLTLEGATVQLEHDHHVGLWATITLPGGDLAHAAARSLRVNGDIGGRELCGLSIGGGDILESRFVNGVEEVYRTKIHEISLTSNPRSTRCRAVLAQHNYALTCFGQSTHYDILARARLARQIEDAYAASY